MGQPPEEQVSRLRTGHQPHEWLDEGESRAYVGRGYVSGSLAVSGLTPTLLGRAPASEETKAKVRAAALARAAAAREAGA